MYYTTDMNNLKISSGYYVNCTNAPCGYCQGFTLRNGSDNDAMQLVAQIDSADPGLYLRTYANAWSNWKKIYNIQYMDVNLTSDSTGNVYPSCPENHEIINVLSLHTFYSFLACSRLEANSWACRLYDMSCDTPAWRINYTIGIRIFYI